MSLGPVPDPPPRLFFQFKQIDEAEILQKKKAIDPIGLN